MKRYTLDRAMDLAAEKLSQILGDETPVEGLRYTPSDVPGDLAYPCFPLAKTMRKNPNAISAELVSRLSFGDGELLERAEAAGGYVNFYFNMKNFCKAVTDDFAGRERYGALNAGEGRTVVIDYSSPNIAKPFSIGHLRSTNIGASLKNILSFAGYTVVGDNHLGDWGTQFGKLIYAYKKWGTKEEVEQDPIRELLKLYVRFHDEAGLEGDEQPESTDSSVNPMEEEARRYFRLLEEGDAEITALWRWVKEISLKDFQRVYHRLGVSFEEVLGESFYNDKMEEIVELAGSKGLIERDESGTLLIRLDEYGIKTPLLIRKKDGASLYATRDLATLLYRIRTWNPARILYVVGEEQQLYFRQLFQAAGLLGFSADCEHVQFGLMLLPEGKVSTRKGNVIFLEDVLQEAVQKAGEILRERELSEETKAQIAETVGIGAVKYQDLSQNRKKTVSFDWDKMLALDGNSSPYLQYSYSRARSILRKSGKTPGNFHRDVQPEPQEAALIKKLARFPEAVKDASEGFYPHIVANYLFELAQDFTAFYSAVKVLSADGELQLENRLFLTAFYAQVMKTGLSLLGIGVMEEM